MRQLIRPFAIVTLLATIVSAAPNSMNDLYTDFQLIRIQIKSTAFTTKSFISQFQAIDQQLQKKYTAFKSLEKEELTSKGNQMSYDLELLEPLRYLAGSKMTQNDCQRALHNNELNYNEDDKQDNETIQKVIKIVCKLN